MEQFFEDQFHHLEISAKLPYYIKEKINVEKWPNFFKLATWKLLCPLVLELNVLNFSHLQIL